MLNKEDLHRAHSELAGVNEAHAALKSALQQEQKGLFDAQMDSGNALSDVASYVSSLPDHPTEFDDKLDECALSLRRYVAKEEAARFSHSVGSVIQPKPDASGAGVLGAAAAALLHPALGWMAGVAAVRHASLENARAAQAADEMRHRVLAEAQAMQEARLSVAKVAHELKARSGALRALLAVCQKDAKGSYLEFGEDQRNLVCSVFDQVDALRLLLQEGLR